MVVVVVVDEMLDDYSSLILFMVHAVSQYLDYISAAHLSWGYPAVCIVSTGVLLHWGSSVDYIIGLKASYTKRVMDLNTVYQFSST